MKNAPKSRSIPSVYGTGLIALDIVIGTNPKESALHWAGGTCGNVLTILSFLGWKSYPIARLNQESSSIRVMEDMRKWKVALNYAEMEPTASVPVIAQEISTNQKGEAVHKFHWRNCPKCGAFLPGYKSVTLQATKVIKRQVSHANLFFFDRTSPGALDLAKHFKSIGATIFFEPSAKGKPDQMAEAIRLADIVKYSEQRFSAIAMSSELRSEPHLEIQTRGENGLRYRLKGRKNWKLMPSFSPKEINDTCGSGDWTTAGIILKLCSKGRKGLIQASAKSVAEALRYGQALGAWNCFFEGARRGMYLTTPKNFEIDIQRILDNNIRTKNRQAKTVGKNLFDQSLCPACP